MTGCTCDAARNVTVGEKLSIGSARRVDGKKDKCAGGEDGGSKTIELHDVYLKGSGVLAGSGAAGCMTGSNAAENHAAAQLVAADIVIDPDAASSCASSIKTWDRTTLKIHNLCVFVDVLAMPPAAGIM